MDMLEYQQTVIQVAEKLHDINEIRKLTSRIRLSQGQEYQLMAAQQVLAWLIEPNTMEPVRTILSDEQLAMLPPFVTSDK